MSVVEQLEKFRYTTVTRECPLSLVRALDVARLRIERPDLQQMKLLTSSISDCCLPSLSDLQQLKPTEIQHLLSTYQAVLQFSLHSQSVLRDQVVAKQNALAAEKITAQHLSTLELKLSAAKKKFEDATSEAQALRLRVHALEKQVGELTTANVLLDRELEYHRAMLARAHSSGTGGEPKAETKQEDAPASNRAEPVETRERKVRKSRTPRQPADTSSSTSLDSSPRRKPSANRAHSSTVDQRYVDWQSFTALLLQQQQLAIQSTKPPSAAAAPSPPPQPAATLDVAPPSQQQQAPQQVQASVAGKPSSNGETEAILAAVRSGLRENQNEFLKQTQETIANVELGLTNRILKSQEEQRAHHQALVKQVEQSEVRWNTAFQSVSKQVATLREDQELQMKLLKADVNTAVSSISRQASIPSGTAPATGTAPVVATRSASPSVLPPLPLAQVQADLANTSATGGKTANAAASGASPVATPGSAFGPRLLSSAGSNGDATSDEDDEGDSSPYVPMSKQTTTEACRHCRQRYPVGELAVHETNCELRVVSCKQCKMSVVARLLPTHKCATAEPLPASADKSGVADVSFQESSFNASSIQPAAVTRKPSSQLLKDTQDELQRLLDEDAAEEARRAAAAGPKKQ